MWALFASLARAHGGAIPIRGVYDWSGLPDLEPGAWIVWEFFPSIVIGCFGIFAFYAWVATYARKKYNLADEGPTKAQWWMTGISLSVVFWALQGPLHELSDVYLFSGHMVQHLAITLLFPPLFLRGVPGWMWDAVLSKSAALRSVGRFLTHPIIAAVIGNAALFFWHIPSMYDWALEDHNVHIVEHLSFMITAVVMWWPALTRSKQLPALSAGKRILYLFALTVPMKVLGMLITLADEILYTYYTTQPRVFGLDPLTDQRTGGLIMWVPAGLVLWVSMFAIFYKAYQKATEGTARGAAA